MRGFVEHDTTEKKANTSNEWYTPPEIFELLKNPTFDLDPCSPGKDKVPWIPAVKHYTASDNGLLMPWTGKVWLNPPYGKETPVWLDKLALHGNGIALVFARTDTKWFHRLVTKADVVCFLAGRVSFVSESGQQGGSAACGSLLLAWGDCADILINANVGWTIDNRKLNPLI